MASPARLTLSNFVNGEHVSRAAGQTSEVADPSTGEPYALAPVSGPADAGAALRAAAAAFEGWRDTTPAERSLALPRMADAVESRLRRSSPRNAATPAKPVGITMAEEIPPLVDALRFFAGFGDYTRIKHVMSYIGE